MTFMHASDADLEQCVETLKRIPISPHRKHASNLLTWCIFLTRTGVDFARKKCALSFDPHFLDANRCPLRLKMRFLDPHFLHANRCPLRLKMRFLDPHFLDANRRPLRLKMRFLDPHFLDANRCPLRLKM